MTTTRHGVWCVSTRQIRDPCRSHNPIIWRAVRTDSNSHSLGEEIKSKIQPYCKNVEIMRFCKDRWYLSRDTRWSSQSKYDLEVKIWKPLHKTHYKHHSSGCICWGQWMSWGESQPGFLRKAQMCRVYSIVGSKKGDKEESELKKLKHSRAWLHMYVPPGPRQLLSFLWLSDLS